MRDCVPNSIRAEEAARLELPRIRQGRLQLTSCVTDMIRQALFSVLVAARAQALESSRVAHEQPHVQRYSSLRHANPMKKAKTGGDK